jgi:hypothetical protein
MFAAVIALNAYSVIGKRSSLAEYRNSCGAVGRLNRVFEGYVACFQGAYQLDRDGLDLRR